jgi:hypothetical protein
MRVREPPRTGITPSTRQPLTSQGHSIPSGRSLRGSRLAFRQERLMRSGGSGWTRAAGRVPAVLAWRTAPVPSRRANHGRCRPEHGQDDPRAGHCGHAGGDGEPPRVAPAGAIAARIKAGQVTCRHAGSRPPTGVGAQVALLIQRRVRHRLSQLLSRQPGQAQALLQEPTHQFPCRLPLLLRGMPSCMVPALRYRTFGERRRPDNNHAESYVLRPASPMFIYAS